MLDVILPVSRNNIMSACASLDALFLNTDIATRVIAKFDGGKRSEYLAVETLLKTSGKEWVATHSVQPVYYNKCILDALRENTTHDRVLTLSPGVILKDDHWFMKMCFPFGKDPQAAMTLAGPADTPSGTMPPNKMKVKSVPYAHHRLAMLRVWDKLRLKEFDVPEGVDVIEAMTKKMMQDGYTVWRTPGVKYTIWDYVEHAIA